VLHFFYKLLTHILAVLKTCNGWVDSMPTHGWHWSGGISRPAALPPAQRWWCMRTHIRWVLAMAGEWIAKCATSLLLQ
jgi:hypothetical protein